MGRRFHTNDWQREPLCHLIAFIVGKHHWVLRQRVARLSGLEGFLPLELLGQLIHELSGHIQQEEQLVFPYISMLAETSGGSGKSPWPFFGSLLVVGEALKHKGRDIRVLIKRLEQTVPVGNKSSEVGERLRRELQIIREGLTPHLELEEEFLFPRAVELEQALHNSAKPFRRVAGSRIARNQAGGI